MRILLPMAVAALISLSDGAISGASAAPQQLSCTLTDTDTKPQSENIGVVVIFDEDMKTLTADQNNRHFSFGKISISNVSISGQADDVSFGIDRSSFGIVWQQYTTGDVQTHFGRCRPT